MRKFTLLIASLFITIGAMAQTAVLRIDNPDVSSGPVELTSEQVEKIRSCNEAVTVVADVTITNSSANSVLFGAITDYTSAETGSSNIIGLGTGGNGYRIHLGTSGSYYYTKGNKEGTAVSTDTKRLFYVINRNKTVNVYAENGNCAFQTVVETSDLFGDNYAGENTKFYIGGIIHSSNSVYAPFSNAGTISSISFYDGEYTPSEIHQAEQAAALAIVDGIEGKIGYPTNDVIENYMTAINNATDLAGIEAAKQELYSSTEINLPVDGKAYTFTFVQKNGTEYYMNCTGTAIAAPVACGTDPIPYTAVFVAEVNDDGTFAFRTYNSKYIRYPKDGTTLSDTKTNDTKIGVYKILDSGTGNVQYVYAPNDDNAYLFGMVYMKRNDRVFVVNGDGQWDGSAAAHYEVAGDHTNAGRVFSSAVRIEEVKGAYYRLKNVDSNWYATSNMSTVSSYTNKLAMEEAGNTPQSIWYRTYDDKLLSYAKGQYLGDFASDGNGWTFEEVGSAGNNATFHAGATEGTYQIRPSSGRALYGDDKRVDAASSSNNSENYNWILEEVTFLPVEIKSAGYATFYAPVEVTIPENVAVTAHTVTINGNWATLSDAIKVIPANTPVILKGAADTYNFAITTTGAAAIEGNALSGTVAAKYAGEEKDVYVLAIADATNDGEDNPEIGMFKAENPALFVLNSHKAYLELPKEVANNSNGFRFDFGDGTTTEIEKVEMKNEKEEIFDLQGRRINEITCPGIYIVNGKKTLVK